MRFEVLHHDATSRLGVLQINGKKTRIPTILWYSSKRIDPPEYAELKLGADIKTGNTFFFPKQHTLSIPPALIYPHFFPSSLHKKSFSLSEKFFGETALVSPKVTAKKAQFYVLTNSRELWNNPQLFAEAIVSVRKKIGYSLLYAPGIATPANLSVLSYCGIDFFDSIELVRKTRTNIYYTENGHYQLDKINEYPCSCPACSEGITSYDALLSHNYYILEQELKKLKHMIYQKNLRYYVEVKSNFDPKLLTIIRCMDRHYQNFQESRFSIISNPFTCTYQSLYRPDIIRFRERVTTRYKKPASSKILILLPCSARKPYSKSKSHYFFNQAISKCKNQMVIHELILTSPIGIVPRELEYTYPASHYDISVTGEWSREEIDMINSTLQSYLKHNKYDAIINHMPPNIPICLDKDIINTCKDSHPTSDQSLKNLEDSLLRLSTEYPLVTRKQRKNDDVRSLLTYQFGSPSKNLVKNCNITGKPPCYKLYEGATQLACFVPARGLFSLTLSGADKLDRINYWVNIDDFPVKGDIFSIGVTDADQIIRIGDEVTVYCEKELRGVGVACMSGDEMVQSSTGLAVKVRHHL